jgi:hypothetical protein
MPTLALKRQRNCRRAPDRLPLRTILGCGHDSAEDCRPPVEEDSLGCASGSRADPETSQLQRCIPSVAAEKTGISPWGIGLGALVISPVIGFLSAALAIVAPYLDGSWLGIVFVCVATTTAWSAFIFVVGRQNNLSGRVLARITTGTGLWTLACIAALFLWLASSAPLE